MVPLVSTEAEVRTPPTVISQMTLAHLSLNVFIDKRRRLD
jgi:hypothetical protein